MTGSVISVYSSLVSFPKAQAQSHCLRVTIELLWQHFPRSISDNKSCHDSSFYLSPHSVF